MRSMQQQFGVLGNISAFARFQLAMFRLFWPSSDRFHDNMNEKV